MSSRLKQPLIQWLEENHLISPYIMEKDIKIHSLFVDNKALDYHFDIEDISADKTDFIQSTIDQLKEIYYIFLPKETFFFSVDGTRPVSRYQTLRCVKLSKAAKGKYDNDFKYPDEEMFYEGNPMQDPELFDNGIKAFLTDLKSKNGQKTKRYIYSCEFTPGESEQKFFNYFRKWKESKDYISNQNHFIYSANPETILYSLKFIDEKIYIIYPYYEKEKQYKIIDVSKIRQYFIDKVPSARTVDYSFQNRLIDDIIGLMLIVDNKFIPRIKLFKSKDIKCSEIFGAYYQLNQNIRKPYKYLIENKVFIVDVLKELSSIMSKNAHTQDQYEEQKKYDIQRQKTEKKYLPTIVLGGGTGIIGDYSHNEFVQEKISSVNQLPSVPSKEKLPVKNQPNNIKPVKNPPNNSKQAQNPPNNSKQVQNPLSNLKHFQDPPNNFNQAQNPPNFYYYQVQYPANPPQQQKQQIDVKVEKRKKGNDIEITIPQSEKAQELLRIYNYAFNYYIKGPPSLNYYYPFKDTLSFASAVRLMQPEGIGFFIENVDDSEAPEKLLEILIVLPVYFWAGPWSIYQVKIPEFSDIATKYWDRIHDPKYLPIFRLNDIKYVYKQVLEQMSEEEVEMFNRRVDGDFILE